MGLEKSSVKTIRTVCSLDSSDGPQDGEATATAASVDEVLASAPILRTSKTCAYCWHLPLPWASNSAHRQH